MSTIVCFKFKIKYSAISIYIYIIPHPKAFFFKYLPTFDLVLLISHPLNSKSTNSSCILRCHLSDRLDERNPPFKFNSLTFAVRKHSTRHKLHFTHEKPTVSGKVLSGWHRLRVCLRVYSRRRPARQITIHKSNNKITHAHSQVTIANSFF